MSQHAPNVNVVLTVDQIKQRMPLPRGKTPSGQKTFMRIFPEGKREVGEGEGGEELGRWYDLFRVIWFPSLDRSTVNTTPYAATQIGLY